LNVVGSCITFGSLNHVIRQNKDGGLGNLTLKKKVSSILFSAITRFYTVVLCCE